MNPLVIFRDDSSPILLTFDAAVRGTAAAETVRVATGTEMSFTANFDDRLEFADDLAAYDFTQQGNQLLVENTDTGTRAEIGINDVSEFAFADGTATVSIGLEDGTPSISLGGETVDETFDPTNVQRDVDDISAIAGGSARSDTTAPEVPSGQTLDIPENQSAGTGIAIVDAEDNPGGTGIDSFSLTGDGTASDFVDIQNDGRLVLTEAGASDDGFTDFETAPNTFTVNVTATDRAGNESLASQVTLRVTDVDDTPPTIAAGQTIEVPDNAGTGDTLGTLAASDNDGGAGIANFFTSGDAGGFVNIAADGTVTLSSAGAGDAAFGDFDTTPNSFTMTVEAGDAVGNTSETRDVTLEVVQGDDVAPSVLGDDSQDLGFDPGATGAGDTIGQVQATDDGPNGGTGVADFEIVGGGGAEFVEIAADGTLTLTEDASPSFSIEVTAEDAAGNVSAPQSLTIEDTSGFF